MITHNHASAVAKLAIILLFLLMPSFMPISIAPSALAEEAAPPGKLVKVVMLSRDGVRAPIPSQSELATWTELRWPFWYCSGKSDFTTPCDSGELTPRGLTLAEQMGTYYRTYLSEFLPPGQCPEVHEVFFWADTMQRTEETGLALLRGFRPPPCDGSKYFHKAKTSPDRIFHPVTADGKCKLDPVRAEREIMTRAGGSLSNVVQALELEFKPAQHTLQCCPSDRQSGLCQTTWTRTCGRSPPPPNTCTLTHSLVSCLVRHPDPPQTPTQVNLGGALRVASTFAEILLLEYANGFPLFEVGWGRITREQMTSVFRLHTKAFDLEQRTPYIASLQGSMLMQKMLLALNDETDGQPGSAPPGAKLVAYVGHDTNIANVAGMLSLSWLQPGYQSNQTPPAGALIFEVRQTDDGARNVHAYYAAQSLDDMHKVTGTTAIRTPVPISVCPNGSSCSPREFAKRVKLDPDCAQ
jgi:4-phytase / acid phosphatase